MCMNNPNEWEHTEVGLKREFEFVNFTQAMVFINKVADIAEKVNHHPTIVLHSYNKVTLTLFTHKEKSITQKDFELALVINAFVIE